MNKFPFCLFCIPSLALAPNHVRIFVSFYLLIFFILCSVVHLCFVSNGIQPCLYIFFYLFIFYLFVFLSFYLRFSFSPVDCLLDCLELQTTLLTSLFLVFLSSYLFFFLSSYLLIFLSHVQLFTCGMSPRLSPVTSHFPQALPTTPTFADFALLWFPPSLLFKKDKVS